MYRSREFVYFNKSNTPQPVNSYAPLPHAISTGNPRRACMWWKGTELKEKYWGSYSGVRWRCHSSSGILLCPCVNSRRLFPTEIVSNDRDVCSDAELPWSSDTLTDGSNVKWVFFLSPPSSVIIVLSFLVLWSMRSIISAVAGRGEKVGSWVKLRFAWDRRSVFKEGSFKEGFEIVKWMAGIPEDGLVIC
jgi:hypothetical protein